MEIITKEEVLKLYDNQELSDDEIEDVLEFLYTEIS